MEYICTACGEPITGGYVAVDSDQDDGKKSPKVLLHYELHHGADPDFRDLPIQISDPRSCIGRHMEYAREMNIFAISLDELREKYPDTE